MTAREAGLRPGGECALEEGAWATVDNLYRRYGVWATAEGVRDELSKNALGRELTARGIGSGKKKIGNSQVRIRTGIRLRKRQGRVTDDD